MGGWAGGAIIPELFKTRGPRLGQRYGEEEEITPRKEEEITSESIQTLVSAKTEKSQNYGHFRVNAHLGVCTDRSYLSGTVYMLSIDSCICFNDGWIIRII